MSAVSKKVKLYMVTACKINSCLSGFFAGSLQDTVHIVSCIHMNIRNSSSNLGRPTGSIALVLRPKISQCEFISETILSVRY